MKPKCSTGYLTPQASKSKRTSKVKRAESNENLNSIKDLSDSFFQKLMSCPIKRQLVLSLINSEKDNIEQYKHNHAKENRRREVEASPLSKIKRNYHCESPTALLRRRALEQKNNENRHDNQENHQSDSSCSSSVQSSGSSCSTIPVNKLLDGVVAYVEIKNKDQDRSSGAKVLMRNMGATVREQFTKDVTHVVFKNGSFTTYQKAKLMRVHLVSVLWIEAIRNNNMRVPEKKFPALGTESYDNNASTFCSQMQREYEDLIREELHRSLLSRTPLPSTQALIDRRRTLMTPVPSSSHKLSQEFRSSQDIEVERILHSRRQTYNFDSRGSPMGSMARAGDQISSDEDSDVDLLIDGTNITRRNSSLLLNLLGSDTELNNENTIEDSNMDITCLGKATPLNSNLKSRRSNLFRRNKSITNLESSTVSNESLCNVGKENSSPNNSAESIHEINTPKRKHIESGTKSLQDKECNILENTMNNRSRKSKLKNNRKSLYVDDALVSELSSLQILSKNVSSNNTAKCDMPTCKDVSNVISSVTAEKSSSTNMSSLQVSLNKEKSETSTANEIGRVSTSTNMSSLLIPSDSSKDKSTSVVNRKHSKTASELDKSSINKSSSSFQGKESFSPINADVIKQVLQTLDVKSSKDENVTRRQKRQSTVLKRTYNTRGQAGPAVDVNAMESDSGVRSNKDITTNPSPSKKAKTVEETPHNSSTDTLDTDTHQKKDVRKSADKKTKSKKRISKHVKITSNTSKEVEENCMLSDHSQNSLQHNKINNKLNRTRKLYNPDESIKEIIINDDLERKEKRNEVKKRKSNEGVALNINVVTVSPNTLLSAAAKEFVDQNEINIKDILNKNMEQSPNDPKLSKQRKPKKDMNKISRNSAADEQRQLAVEFLKRNDKITKNTKQESTAKKQEIIKRRKSTRLSQNPRRKLNLDSSSSSSDGRILPTTPLVNRRSTMEFQTKSQMSSNKKLKIDKNKRPSIVCTKLHKEDIQTFFQIVRNLGGFVIEDEVSNKTTHLVAGEPKRTINMLRAMTMGCWILKHEWLLRSLEERKWLPEEDYEETDFSPAVQQCRLQRQAFGPSYTMDIFQECGRIYVARGTTPRCSDLKELVALCKGNVCTIPRNAAIVVGEFVKYEGVKCVKEAWVLDSITFNKKLPFRRYLITPTNNSPTV